MNFWSSWFGLLHSSRGKCCSLKSFFQLCVNRLFFSSLHSVLVNWTGLHRSWTSSTSKMNRIADGELASGLSDSPAKVLPHIFRNFTKQSHLRPAAIGQLSEGERERKPGLSFILYVAARVPFHVHATS